MAGVAQWTECQPVDHRPSVRLLVRAHPWVAGQVPSRGRARGKRILMFLSLSPSLPLSLKINKKKFKKIKEIWERIIKDLVIVEGLDHIL